MEVRIRESSVSAHDRCPLPFVSAVCTAALVRTGGRAAVVVPWGGWSPRGATRYCQSHPASHSCITVSHSAVFCSTLRQPARGRTPSAGFYLCVPSTSGSTREPRLIWIGVAGARGESTRGKPSHITEIVCDRCCRLDLHPVHRHLVIFSENASVRN